MSPDREADLKAVLNDPSNLTPDYWIADDIEAERMTDHGKIIGWLLTRRHPDGIDLCLFTPLGRIFVFDRRSGEHITRGESIASSDRRAITNHYDEGIKPLITV